MKNKYRVFVILALGMAGLDLRLAAQEVGPTRSGGRVLLLQSDRGLEGDIEKIGEQYRIRRGASEVWLPADKAVRLCTDWEDAYAFMKTRANLGDPDERLRLARWCQLNNLRPQALVEAKAALEMRPTHEESRQLVTMMTRTLASLPNVSPKNAAAQTVKIPVAAASCDISADSFALFATRVQPVLMNTCVNCHSGGRGGEFQLIRTEGGQRGSTQANLTAVLAQVNVDHPVLSPLLIKAVSRHGNAANAPIKDRQTIPFNTLQGWIDYLLANNPHLKYQKTDAVAASPAKKELGPVAFAQEQSAPPARARPPAASQPAPRTEVPRETVTPLPVTQRADVTPLNSPSAAPGASRETQVNTLDPFDPTVFNRQVPTQK